MTFKELFTGFIAGTPIKRKAWGGYWKNDLEKGFLIYTKEGKILNFKDTLSFQYTIAQTLEDDWEVATNENCDIPVN